MAELLLACRDCGQIYRAGSDLPRRRWLLCRRCGGRLWRLPSVGRAELLAFAATAAILFVAANAFPLFEVDVSGDRRTSVIASGAVALAGYGGGTCAVAALLAMVVIPALSLALVVIALVRLNVIAHNGANPRPRIAGSGVSCFICARGACSTFICSAVVAYTRLGQLARVAVAAGGYALGALVLMQILIEQSLSRYVGCGCGEEAKLSGSDPSGPMPDWPPAPEPSGWAGLPWVWAVPVVALVIAGWLGFRALVERGPTITISFETAERIESGRTTIRYKDVELGAVTKVGLSPTVRVRRSRQQWRVRRSRRCAPTANFGSCARVSGLAASQG